MSLPATAAEAVEVESGVSTRKQTTLRSIMLVVACTIFGAVAQILIKFGPPSGPNAFAHGLFANWWLLGGLSFLGVNTLLLVVALREGQLSVLYPIIALTYVWVVILSPMFFDDKISLYKAIGVGVIVLGVSLIGWGSRQ
ncbi:MAG: EamA family transporter [Bryobacterales bacterium]